MISRHSFPRRRTPLFFLRAAVNRRTPVVLWKMLHIYPPPWSAKFWEPDFRLARQALRRDAAQKIREFTQLIRLLRGHRLDTVIEIGTDRGGTLYTWCRLASPKAKIISIDLRGGRYSNPGGTLPESVLLGYRQHAQDVQLVWGDSHSEETLGDVLRAVDGRRVDFLMIDGDHTYEGVRTDFEMYAPLVRGGGIIALHDILPTELDPLCGVDRFWAEVVAAHSTEELIDTYDDRGVGQWGGIGVVFWRGQGAR
jgi:predicted O-methyltransferase YrrM